MMISNPSNSAITEKIIVREILKENEIFITSK